MSYIPYRGLVAFVHDIAMAGVSFLLAAYLRLGNDMWRVWDSGNFGVATATYTGVAAATFLSLRLYRGVWRYASVRDLIAVVRAVTLISLIFPALMFLLSRLQEMPRSVLVINWFVLLALLGAPRFIYRAFKDHRQRLKLSAREGRVPVLLVGAGDEADLFIRASQSSQSEYRPVGLISEGRGRVGRNIHGLDVLGSVDELEAVIAQLRQRKLQPQRLIITDNRLDGALVRRLLDEADRLGLTLSRMPRLTDLKDGIGDKLEIRPIAVEDLLGRPQAVLDRERVAALIRGRRVLVTGAGGSIGSELVRQIADIGPAALALVDACEFNLYSIDLEMERAHPDLQRYALLANVRDARRIESVMTDFRPELVFHAAALKHVPMVEHNPAEGVFTNAVGTRIVAEACRQFGVMLMVQISTDKAVNPTNVMGASKRVAEMYTQALDMVDPAGGGTRFVTVRFGNVLGSTGSVVPLFQKQLSSGGPLTVTHPDMTRYFMTVREAVELVLQASVQGIADDAMRGKICVLDMGEPVRIVDLARQMIRLGGLRPEIDIPIVFTGLRPGEKLFEEIFHGSEPLVASGCPGLLFAAPRAVDYEELRDILDRLRDACAGHRSDQVLELLHALVPEYAPPRSVASPA